VRFANSTHSEGMLPRSTIPEPVPSKMPPQRGHGLSCSRAKHMLGLRVREDSGSLVVFAINAGTIYRSEPARLDPLCLVDSDLGVRRPGRRPDPPDATHSGSSAPEHDGLYGAGEENQVQPYRPVADVIGVHPDPFVEGGMVTPGHLPRSCYPWRHA
jgi:hypothetical protein